MDLARSNGDRLAGSPTALQRALDAALEATVVGSFSRLGFAVRKRAEHWGDPPRLDDRVVVLTGGSSGIGLAAARALGHLGAAIWLVGRDPDRTRAGAREAKAAGSPWAEPAIVDLADPGALEAFADRIYAKHQRLDGLIHGAGALLRDYSTTGEGVERTVATHVLAPFRLTWRLAPPLRSAATTRVPAIVTVTSGGMYTERFELHRLEAGPDNYDGVRAYARAKRAQVVLSRAWARRWAPEGVASYATHPGWVDTPGLAAGLPSFARLRPALRRPEEGADTAVWLVAGGARGQTDQPGHPDKPGQLSQPSHLDGLWLDRRRRGEYYLPWTRPSNPRRDEDQLWAWCAERTGLGAKAEDGQ